MAVDVIIDDVAAFLAPHMVGKSAEPREIRAREKAQPVFLRQPLAAHDLFFNIPILCTPQQKNAPLRSAHKPRRLYTKEIPVIISCLL